MPLIDSLIDIINEKNLTTFEFDLYRVVDTDIELLVNLLKTNKIITELKIPFHALSEQGINKLKATVVYCHQLHSFIIGKQQLVNKAVLVFPPNEVSYPQLYPSVEEKSSSSYQRIHVEAPKENHQDQSDNAPKYHTPSHHVAISTMWAANSAQQEMIDGVVRNRETSKATFLFQKPLYSSSIKVNSVKPAYHAITEAAMEIVTAGNFFGQAENKRIFEELINSCLEKKLGGKLLSKATQEALIEGIVQAIKPFWNAYTPTYFEQPIVRLKIKNACEINIEKRLKTTAVQELFLEFQTKKSSEASDSLTTTSIKDFATHTIWSNGIDQIASKQNQVDSNNNHQKALQQPEEESININKINDAINEKLQCQKEKHAEDMRRREDLCKFAAQLVEQRRQDISRQVKKALESHLKDPIPSRKFKWF